jgi:hypothetical protein
MEFDFISKLEFLRGILQWLEQSSDISVDDPGVLELKQILRRKIALLEAAISATDSAAA